MKIHCCELMDKYIQDKRIPIEYDPVLREYRIPLYRSSVVQLIIFCPWCGARLPTSLRFLFFDILQHEYGLNLRIIDIANKKGVPVDFQTDAWWKKRNL